MAYMADRPKTSLTKLPPIAPTTNPAGELVGNNTGDGLTLQEWTVKLTPIEENFARLFVLYNNATRAYIEASNSTAKRSVARVMAWEMGHRPHVRKRVQEYYSLAAAATVIDYAAILENDRQIVEGFKHADEITQHIHECCRYCHGTEHRYQWRDFEEYVDALKRVDLENDKRRELGQRELSQPSDSGGYGFDPQAEPNLFCPRCEGRGIAVNVIADTTKLQGPARAIVKGIKVTANGTEVVFHDVDKAKERLLRAGGILKDDAASVARGAAAGAAAGATAAIAAAKAADSMTLDEAQRLYQQLA
jgi:phage terminase small subunit